MVLKLVLAIALCIASSTVGANLPGTLIVGGEEAAKNQFPHLVRLWVPAGTTVRFCSGSLIALDLVLTSAGCVENYDKQIIVTAGDHSLIDADETEQSLTSQQVISHENFDRNNKQDNDIALIKLSGKFVQTGAVRPIALPAPGFDPDLSEFGIAAGWGATTVEDVLEDKVQTANLRIFDRAQCVAFPLFELGEGGFCTLDTKGGLQSDYGGPLICSEMLEAICGIMSISIPEIGQQNGILGVYVNVASYLEWIAANTPVDPTTTTRPTETSPSETSSSGTSPTTTSPSETSPIGTSPSKTSPTGTSPTTTGPTETRPTTTSTTESTPAGSSKFAASLFLTFIFVIFLLY